MKLEGQSYEHLGMRRADRLMRDYFKDSIELVKYWGPVQMCVFYLEYEYFPMHYKIIVECERGVITICVENQEGKKFSPWMIYSNANYYHYEDRIEDVVQLIKLTYQAIMKREITFFNNKEIAEIKFSDKR